ncbi:hypothetical protein EDB80DRAFT_593930, partial [Ilyonectria destructans]
VQLVDFGTRVLSETREVYNSASGQALEMDELSEIASEIAQLSKNIEDKSALLNQPQPIDGSSEAILLKTCNECKELCSELINAIKELRPLKQDIKRQPGRVFSSFVLALKGVLNVERRRALRLRLCDGRERMMFAMLTVLWEKSVPGTRVLGKLSCECATIATALGRSETSSHTINSPLIQALDASHSEADSKRGAIIQSIWSSKWDMGAHELLLSRAKYLSIGGGETDYRSCTNEIIKSLSFRDIDYRERAILGPHEETFEWIFTEPPITQGGKPLWSDYTTWLKSSVPDIYWITGKPGAGKSTLMKFLIEDEAIKQHLRLWSSDRPLILSTFYSWNAGSEMQKSQEGLLRTLLSQCLAQMREIIPKVCPRRWALFKIFGSQAFEVAPDWTWYELLESFSALCLLAGDEFNLAVFIDGLDEFEGEHDKLVGFVKLLHSHPGTKICVSSRPWNVLLDAFSYSPSLQIEDLTAGDIEKFVKSEFQRTPGFRELRDALPSDASQLIDGIISKAQGVFLWVSVVVQTLRDGLTEGDRLADLQAVLDELPSDLSGLYQNIWSRMKPGYLAHSSQLFQIHRCSTSSLGAVTMWLADEENSLDENINIIRQQRARHILQVMKRRVNSRTGGLLEVSDYGQVDYLHRTVRDWILTIWPEICSKSPAQFDPHLALLKACTADIPDTSFWMDRGASIPDDFWDIVRTSFHHASLVRDYTPNIPFLVKVLDRLDSNLTEVSTSCRLANGTLPLYGHYLAPRSSGDNLPHWSNTRYFSPESTTTEGFTPFLGLAAEYAVAPYVRQK